MLRSNVPKAKTGKEKLEGFDITGKGINSIKYNGRVTG